MTIDNFVIQFIEGYLFKDLQKMQDIKLRNDENSGACGYPMLMSILAGIELLGLLTSQKQVTPTNINDRGKDDFDNYWNKKLVAINPVYKKFDSFFRAMIRNALMHTYLTKSNIAVYKGGSHVHMTYSKGENPVLNIDTSSFFTDFKKSYEVGVRPIIENDKTIDGVNKTTMQNRLNELENYYHSQAIDYFEKLPDPLIPNTYFHIPSSGASTSTSTSTSTSDFSTNPFNTPPITGSI